MAEEIQQTVFRLVATVEVLVRQQSETLEKTKEIDRTVQAVRDNVSTNIMTVQTIVRDAARSEQDRREERAAIHRLIETLQRNVEALTDKFDDLSDNIKVISTEAGSLRIEVEELKKPVRDFIKLRRHVYAIGALVASVIGSLWFVIGPASTWFVQHFLSGFFGKTPPTN